MSERRFSEEEVAEILKYAAEAEHSSKSLLPAGNGLTLTELQEIGREVGISPAAMQQAAQKFGNTSRPTRTFLGFPIGVGRTVELDRKLTDEEWELVVADLREKFEARGVVRQEGSLRSWSNGNLQALLEPTANGQRLRLRTVKGNAQGLIGAGIAMFGMSAAMALIAAVKGTLVDAGFLSSLAVIATTGAMMFGAGALGLPRWARVRQQQMDEIAEQVAGVTPRLTQ